METAIRKTEHPRATPVVLIATMLTLSVAAVLTGLPLVSPNTAPTAPTGLLTDELEHPLAVEGAPRFGWWVNDTDDDSVQSAYRIVVRDALDGALVWDSGRVASSDQSNVRYAGTALKPAHPYSWTVRTWDAAGARSPSSAPATFATGLSDGDWRAQWLQAPAPIGALEDGAPVPAPAPATGSDIYWQARTERPLASKPIVRALAYVSSPHEYELSVNGNRIGRGWTYDYPGETRYQGWDVTSALGSDHTIAVGILSHWFSAGQGRAAAAPGLIARIVVYYADGTQQAVTTDRHWVGAPSAYSAGPPRGGEGVIGERWDARIETTGWTSVGYDDSTWTPAYVVGSHPTSTFTHLRAELAHETETVISPVSVTTLGTGVTVVDFGRVVPGRFTIDFRAGVAGRAFDVRLGYLLTADGQVDASLAATQSTDMSYGITQRNGGQRYRSWDYLGFRYLQIPPVGEAFTKEQISATVMHTELPPGHDARFSSSNSTLDAVYELMCRSALYSTQYQFVDTPTREKGQFLQDAINVSSATLSAWGERAVTRKAIIQFLRSADRYWSSDEADRGRYNAVYPNGDGKRDIPDFTLGLPAWVWDYYVHSGDRELLTEAYPYIRRTADYIARAIPANGATAGLVTQLPGGSGAYRYGIVDWPEASRFGYDMTTVARTTVNALAVHVLDTAGAIAEELDRPEREHDDYARRASALRASMNARLLNPESRYSDGILADGTLSPHVSQHANSYALAFGIAPEELVGELGDYVAGLGMKQGPMTAGVLLRGLFAAGEADAAVRLLTDADDLGWARILREGGTFTWEQWTYGQSLSHGWGSAAAADVLENLLGVTVVGPGGSKVRIAPAAGALERADGRVVAERGPVEVSYSGAGTDYRISVTVPANVEAVLVLPRVAGGRFVESSGRSGVSAFTDDAQRVTVGSGERSFVFRSTS